MSNFELLPDEEVIKTANGDCWETPTMLSSQVPGQFLFTNQRVIFRGGGVIEKLRIKFAIPYTEIRSIEPWLVVFFKTGIRIRMKDGDCYRISVKKREEFMEIINQHIGNA